MDKLSINYLSKLVKKLKEMSKYSINIISYSLMPVMLGFSIVLSVEISRELRKSLVIKIGEIMIPLLSSPNNSKLAPNSKKFFFE